MTKKRARDPIPVEAIHLTQAYERVLDVVCQNPNILPAPEQLWAEALEESRRFEYAIQDPSEFDEELADYWHQRKRANVFLRQAIADGELVACVRDPKTGDILQLACSDWLPLKWEGYVPAGIWDDYIVRDDYEAPGPLGSFMRGALRPVFFLKASFEIWFGKHFSTAEAQLGVPNPAVAGPSDNANARAAALGCRTKAHKLIAVRTAIQAVYGETGLDGVSERTRSDAVNKYLIAHGKESVSDVTIRRALKLMGRQ